MVAGMGAKAGRSDEHDASIGERQTHTPAVPAADGTAPSFLSVPDDFVHSCPCSVCKNRVRELEMELACMTDRARYWEQRWQNVMDEKDGA